MNRRFNNDPTPTLGQSCIDSVSYHLQQDGLSGVVRFQYFTAAASFSILGINLEDNRIP